MTEAPIKPPASKKLEFRKIVSQVGERVGQKIQEWTVKGKEWLAGLKEKVTHKPKEVLQDIAEASHNGSGFIRKEPEVIVNDGADAESAKVVQGRETEGQTTETEQIVYNDITAITGEIGRIDGSNVRDVLKRLRQQVESGVTLQETGIQVVDSINDALPAELLQAINEEVVFHNERVPEDKRVFGYLDFRDEKLGKSFDADAYDRVWCKTKHSVLQQHLIF